MDTFETAKLGTTTLDHLCRVCLYLGATTLANISNNNGKRILSWALMGKAQCRLMTQWPNQEMPSKYSWQIWRRYLRKFFVTKIPSNLRLDRDWPLDEDLGLWTVSSPLIWRDAYFDHESGTLYVCSRNGCFTQHTRMNGHMSTYTPTQNQLPEPPPNAKFTPTRKV